MNHIRLLDKFRVFYFLLSNPNEEYICGWCLKPVPPRHIYCSVECSKAAEEEQRAIAQEGAE